MTFDGCRGEDLDVRRTWLGVTLAFACFWMACDRSSTSEGSDQSGTSRSRAAHTPVMPAFDLPDTEAQVVFQKVADTAEGDVTFEVCDESLLKKVSVHTTEPTSTAVVMAMLVTQLGAPATVDAYHWTVFCRDAAGPGLLLRKGQPPTRVTIAKAPEDPK
jgi:hypothetical protein